MYCCCSAANVVISSRVCVPWRFGCSRVCFVVALCMQYSTCCLSALNAMQYVLEARFECRRVRVVAAL
jgi:hypothetical protein